MNPFGYSDAVWTRFRAARAAALPAGPGRVVSARAHTPAGKQVLELQCRVEDGRIAAACSRAYGCPTTIAVGEWLAARLAGAEVARPAVLTAPQIREALEIAEDRAHCALLGEDVVRALWSKLSPDE